MCGIGGEITRTGDQLLVRYFLEGDLARLRVPDRRDSRFADELWRHTCFELFMAGQGEASYHEFNFSPSGEWALYAFSRYREPVSSADLDLVKLDPRIAVSQADGRLELRARVQLKHLPPRYGRARLKLGLSAVVETLEDGENSLSYWALAHPLDRPDFHHPDAFVLEFDEIRN